MLNPESLRRMARQCRSLARGRTSVEGKRTLLRMAELYDKRAEEAEAGAFAAAA